MNGSHTWWRHTCPPQAYGGFLRLETPFGVFVKTSVPPHVCPICGDMLTRVFFGVPNSCLCLAQFPKKEAQRNPRFPSQEGNNKGMNLFFMFANPGDGSTPFFSFDLFVCKPRGRINPPDRSVCLTRRRQEELAEVRSHLQHLEANHCQLSRHAQRAHEDPFNARSDARARPGGEGEGRVGMVEGGGGEGKGRLVKIGFETPQ